MMYTMPTKLALKADNRLSKMTMNSSVLKYVNGFHRHSARRLSTSISTTVLNNSSLLGKPRLRPLSTRSLRQGGGRTQSLTSSLNKILM